MRLLNTFVFLVVLLVINPFHTTAQDTTDFEIGFYADIAMNASAAEHRAFANEKLLTILKAELEAGNGFNLNLDSMIWISTIAPPDSTFKLISTQVELEEGNWKYDNFIVYQDGNYTALIDGGKDMVYDSEYAQFTADEMLGMLFYKILPHKDKKGDVIAYLLFGYRGYDQYENVKVVDVLHFENGEPVLGMELFSSLDLNQKEDLKSRLILQYAADSKAHFKYNPNTEMIIFDHLISRMGQMPGQGPTQVSDGSYEAYFYEKGKWFYKEKLFHQTSEKPPLPNPILDKGELFGKGK